MVGNGTTVEVNAEGELCVGSTFEHGQLRLALGGDEMTPKVRRVAPAADDGGDDE